MKRLVLATLLIVGWAVPGSAQAPDESLLARLRAAETVRLVVDESYYYKERNRPAEDPIDGYHLPFDEIATALILAAGQRVAPPDAAVAAVADVTLAITVRARAVGRLYFEGVTGYLYTGAHFVGDITFTATGETPWVDRIDVRQGPPLKLQLNLGYDLPSGAPFEAAFAAPASYIDRIMRMFGTIHGPGPLIDRLDADDDDVRIYAARALGWLGDAAAVPVLIATLADRLPGLRREAAWALGRLGDPSAVPVLTKALKDSDSDVRWFAKWALAEIAEKAPAGSEAAVSADDATD